MRVGFACLLLAGCAHAADVSFTDAPLESAKERAGAVEVSKMEPQRNDCAFVAGVSARNIDRLKLETARLGGNYLKVDSTHATVIDVTMHGRAFHCAD